jgi:aminoglycoside phosphotransferase (APT) family kinase protein
VLLEAAMPDSQEHLSVIINVELVRRLLETQFPQYAALPLEAVQPGGWDNRTFRLGKELSVRLPSAEPYVPQVEKEHCWLPRLAPHLPLPVPVPLALGAPAEGYPWPWSIYGWLEGQPATTSTITDLPTFARSLASFLAALHRIDTADGPAAGSHNFHRGGRLAVYDAETRAALSALAGRIDTASAAEVWAAALSSEWRRQSLWVHGDVASGNLLVKDGNLSAVIDFGSSAVGDPACDLVIAWTEFSGESRTVFRAGLPFDDDTWGRARGWALWKALITVAGSNGDLQAIEKAQRIAAEVIADHRRSGAERPQRRAVKLLR